MDLNEFPSIFKKVQHAHSSHQKTTSNLLRINLIGTLKFNEIWPLEGAVYITLLYLCNSMVEISGAYRKFKFYAIFSENLWFQTKRFTGLLELIQLYKRNTLEKFLIFTIYQKYILGWKVWYFIFAIIDYCT